MQKLLLSTLILASLCTYGQDSSRVARVYLNNSVSAYANTGESSFTQTFIKALESSGGDDQSLNLSELFSFFNSENQKADTVTYGKNMAGTDFVFDKNSSGKNYALIVFVEEYETFEDVNGIKPDATKITDLLKVNYGFETELVENPTRTSFLMTIRKYTTMTYSENDHLFIYFAGRGYYDDLYKWNYLLLKDSQKDDEVKFTYMPVSQLLMLADNISVNKIMVFIDAGTQ